MENDIVPGLLQKIESEFDQRTYSSEKIKNAFQLLSKKKATFLDANEFAVEVGEILADVLGSNITAEVLPDGKMYFNIADRVLNSTMQKNHELISSFAIDVQKELNQLAGINIKGQKPELNQERINGLIEKVVDANDFESAKWVLNEPIINFSQSIVDDTIQKNIEFQAKAGLVPKIIRRVSGHKPCDWCKNLAGSYDYYDAPDDVYRRHSYCRCTVDYDPGDGKRQDVWTKQWRDPEKEAKIEERKLIGIKKETESFEYIDESKFYEMTNKYGKIIADDKASLLDRRNGYIGTSNSFKINKMLRGEEQRFKPGPDSQRTIDILDRAISNNQLQENVLTDRWVKYDWAESLADKFSEEMENASTESFIKMLNSGGKTFEEKGFVSTSLISDKNIFAKSHDIRLNIQVPRGTNAYVTDNVRESEMILQRDSKYEIIKASKETINDKEIVDILVKLIN